MKKRGIVETVRRKQYVIAGALIVIAAIGTTMLYSNSQEKEREQMEEELAEELEGENQPQDPSVAVAEDTEDAAEASAVILPKEKGTEEDLEAEIKKTGAGTGGQETETEEGIVENEDGAAGDADAGQETAENAADDAGLASGADDSGDIAASQASAGTDSLAKELHFSPEDGMIWPMEGNVILNYSMDSTVYFATLDQYKYNPAVIIAGEVNDKVYSVAKGQIASVGNDEVTGCTVTVDLGDGYQAIYGQLKELNFDEGDYVEPGHVLGYLSEPTKYFSEEGCSLYFELRKDGVPVDPVEYFE